MTNLQKGILAIIKSALTGTACPLPEGFSIAEAFPIIKQHQIVTLAYEGASLCGISKTEPEMQRLFKGYCQCLLQSERQMRAAENICTSFVANDIDFLPLKGYNMKKLYPKPELRLMGDADILIRKEQYPAIKSIVEKLGFTEKTESDHEFIWTSPSLFLELHKRLIPSYNRDYYRYFGDGWKLAKKTKTSQFAMTPEDEFIFIFCHFAKHYRAGGIGLRHVTDLQVYLQANPAMDKKYLHAELHKLQLLEFFQNVQKLLSVWFDDAEGDEKTAFMTDFLFASGVWGKQETHSVSDAVKSAHSAGSVKKGKLRQTLQFLFPNKTSLQLRYPVLRKCPILLPFLWPVRWVTGFLFRRDNYRKHRKSLQTATTEKIESYQAALHYVGLDFNFKE